MSSVQKIILKATLIGILIACSILGVFSLSMCLVNGVYSIDLGDFDESLEYGQLVDLEGIEIVDNRFLGLVRKPLTRDMIVSMGLTDKSGEKQIVINHNGKELTIDFHVKYKVEFASYGEVLDTQYVFSADELVPPTAVIPKTGYEFAGWDFDLTLGELTESTQINAVFEEIEYPQLEKINATYGDTLGDIELPSNEYGRWVFIYPSDTPVGDVGRQEYSVRFDFFNDDSVHKYGFVNIEVAKRELVFKDLQQTFIYDGKEHFPTYSLDADVSVIVSGGSQTEVGVYEYSFEIVDANYYGMYVGSFEIKKPTVTVTVSSATVTYPASVPEFTFSVEGFENIELLGIELQVPSFISKAGVFDIDVTYTNENVNYIIHKGTLTVLKGDLEVPAPEITVATFEDQLSDIQFVGKYLGTWTWENPDQIIDSMDKVVAYAIFTHDDPNLNPVRMAIEITGIQKKELSFEIIESVFTYQPGVENTVVYKIVGGRYPELYATLDVIGNDPEINAGSYRRTLTIEDDRYFGSVFVQLAIAKATPETDFTTVFNTRWNETLYLSDITLPEGYTWDKDYTRIEEVGITYYAATFTPEDTDNYISVPGFFAVNVDKADLLILGVKDSYSASYVRDTAFDMTDGVTALFTDGELSFTYYLGDTEVSEIKNVGVYTVVINVTEGTKYYGLTLERTVTITKIDNTETVIPVRNVTYGDSISVLTLPAGVEGTWEWVNAGSTVGGAGTNIFVAKYTCTTGNYNDREVEVTVNVAKADVIVPTIADREFINDILKSGLEDTDDYEVVVSTDIGGKTVGTYKVTLKLKNGDNFKWEGTDGKSDLYEVSYKIVPTNITNLKITLSKNAWEYEDDYAVITASKTEKFGTITLVYSTTKNGIYTETVPTDVGTYYVKAIVKAEDDSETPDWRYAETAPESFTISKDTARITGILQGENDYKYTYSFGAIDVTGGIDVHHIELTASELVFEYWLGGVKVDAVEDPGTYTVKVYAAATTNYKSTSAEFTVVVDKIKNSDIIGDDILTQSHTFSDDISVIKLPTHTGGIGTWSLVTDKDTVGDAGLNTFKAKFTPSSENSKYYAEREITITVNVGRKDVLRPTFNIQTGTYNGGYYIPTIIHRDDSTLYTWDENHVLLTTGAKNVGTYTVTFSLGENAKNYKWENGDEQINLTFVVNPNTNYQIGVTVDSWIYNDSNEGDSKIHVTVPAGVAGAKTIEYFVKNDEGEYIPAVPNNVGTYYVKVTVAADENVPGGWTERSTDYIEFKISPANFSFGRIEIGATYGQTLRDIASELPTEIGDVSIEGTLSWNTPDVLVGNAGYTYTFYATYTSDGNYNNNNAVPIMVTVSKASSSIEGLVNGATIYKDFNGADLISEIKAGVTLSNGYNPDYIVWTVTKDGAGATLMNKGTYTVTASYVGDNNYQAASDVTVTVIIDGITIEPTVSIDGWTYTPDNSNAKAPVPTKPSYVDDRYLSYYYTGITNAGVAYADSAVPTEAGSYTVTLTVAASELGNWALATATCDFEIERADASITVDANHSTSYTGGIYDILSYVVVNKGVGAPDFDIITFNGQETDLTEIIGAGDYVLTVYLAQTPNYKRYEVENVSVHVERATTSITLRQDFYKDYADTDYLGLVINGVYISVDNGVADPDPERNKIVWTVNGVEVDENTKIINQGTYVVVATYAGDDNYKPSSDSCTVTVNVLNTGVAQNGISGIGNKPYDGGAIEATVTLTHSFTAPIVKYYVKNGDTYTWLGVDTNGNAILPTNAGTYRIGISALGDAENGNWTELAETYSADFTISHVVVGYITINPKTYDDGKHVPSGYVTEWRYTVIEGSNNINVGTYPVTFKLNNVDGIINFVWGYDNEGNPIVDDYTTSYRIVSADDNIWSTDPSITPIDGQTSIIYGDGFKLTAAPKFGGFDVTYYLYNTETGEYDIKVGKGVYLKNNQGGFDVTYYEYNTETGEYDIEKAQKAPTDAGDYLAVFSFNDPNHMTDDPNPEERFTIERRTVLRPEFDIYTGTYNGGYYKPTLSHNDDETLYTWDKTNVLLTTGVMNRGTYTVTFDLGGNNANYKWESGDSDNDGKIELSFVLSPKTDYTVGVTVDPWTYNDTNENNSKVHVTVPAGVAGEQTVKYYVKNGDVYTEVTPIKQGTYYVKVSVAADTGSYDNWSAEESDYVKFTILPDDLDFGAIELVAVYGQTLADIASKLPTILGGKDIEGTLSWNVADTTKVGTVAGPNTFTVKYTPDANGNYKAINTITVNITVERLGIEIPTELKTNSFMYGEEITFVKFFGENVVVQSNKAIFDGYTATFTIGEGNIGGYKVVFELDPNHKWIDGTEDGTTENQTLGFTITKAQFAGDITIGITKNEWVYNDPTGTPGYGVPGFVGNNHVSYHYVGTTAAGKSYDSDKMPTEAGTYKVYVVVAATGNWDKQQSTAYEEFTITPKQLTLINGNTGVTFVYGGPYATKDYNHYATVLDNLSLQGIVYGDTVSIKDNSNSIEIINAGTHPVSLELTGADSHNYYLDVTSIDITVGTKTTEVDIISKDKYTAGNVERNGKHFDNIAIKVEVTGRNHGFGTAVVNYYKLDEAGNVIENLGTTAPKNYGYYKAVVTIDADTEHATPNWAAAAPATVFFNIEKAILDPSVSIKDGGWEYDPENKNKKDPTPNNVPGYIDESYLSYTYAGTSYSGIIYSGATVPKDAGNNYTVYLTIAADTVNNNWDTITVSKTFNITRAPVNITFTPTELTYNGGNRYTDIQKMFSSDSGAVWSDFNLTITDENGNTVTAENQGTYRVTASLSITNNYQAVTYPENSYVTVTIKSEVTNVTIGSESYEVTKEDGSTETIVGKVYDKAEIEITVSGRNHSFGTQTVTYYELDENGNVIRELGTTSPDYAGSFKAVVTITADSDNENWPSAEETVKFVINPAPSSIQVSGSVEEDEDENLVVNGIDFNTTDKTFDTLIGAAAVGYVTGDTAEVNYEITGYTKHGVVTYNVRNAEELPTVIQNAGIYIVKVTLTSNKNYVDAEPVYITVTVDKVNYTFGSYNLTATYGQTLSDIESKLPTFDHGYLEWSAPATVVGNAGGTYTFTAVYTNTDGNYKDTDSDGNPLTVNVSVTVGKADTKISGLNPEESIYYSGSDFRDIVNIIVQRTNGTGAVNNPTLEWTIIKNGSTAGEIINAGTYSVVLKYNGDANHNAAEVVYSTVVINKVVLKVDINFAETKLWYTQSINPGATMTDKNNPGTAVTGPVATFEYSSDAENWGTLEELIASHSVDGEHLDAGSYFVKAKVAADTVNGNWDEASSYTSFTIYKIAPDTVDMVVSGPNVNGVYYQNSVVLDYANATAKLKIAEGVYIAAPGTLTYVENSFRFKGPDSTYTVQYTPDDTTNYAACTIVFKVNLKVVAVISDSYTTSYNYSNPDANPATVGNAFGTIEEAVKNCPSGNVWVVPDNTGYVKITANDPIKNSNGDVIGYGLSVPSGVTLILPYSVGQTVGKNTINSDGSIEGVYHNSDSDNTTASERNPMRADAISKHREVCDLGCEANPCIHERCSYCTDTGCNLCSTKVVISSGRMLQILGTVIVSGQLDGGGAALEYTGGTSGYYAELVLEENAKIVVDGTIHVPGFITDSSDDNVNSRIVINKTGKIYQPLVIRDFKGGTATGSIYLSIEHNGIPYSPFNEFCPMNVYVRIEIHGSAYAYANIYADNHQNATITPLVGRDDTFLITLTTDSSYLLAHQSLETEIMKMDLYGGAKVSTFKVTVQVPVVGELTITSQEFIFPISWMYDITLHDGNYVMKNGNRFKLLPGAKFTVASGAELDIEYLTIYNSIDQDDPIEPYCKKYQQVPAILTINGKVTAGTLAGTVYATGGGAELIVTGSTSVNNREPLTYSSNSEVVAGKIFGRGGEVKTEFTFGSALTLIYTHYVDGVLTETNTFEETIVLNKTYVSNSTDKKWEEKQVAIIVLDGFDVTVNGTRYNHGECESVEIVNGSDVIFHLAPNQFVSESGATSFTYSEYTKLLFGGTGDKDDRGRGAYELDSNDVTATKLSQLKVLTAVKVTITDGSKYVTKIEYSGDTNDSGELIATITASTGDETIYKNGGSLAMTVTGGSVSFTSNTTAGSVSGGTYTIGGTNGSNGTTENITATIKVSSTGSVSIIVVHKPGEKENSGPCVTPDTLITLADGTQVRVDSLTGDELLLVWNLETGKLDFAPIMFVDSDPTADFAVIYLHFSDGTVVKVIGEHGFWDYDLNRYVYLDENAADFIGHYFAKQNGDELEKVQLVNVEIKTELTTAWSPVTVGHLCYFVNGMLSMPGGVGGLFNIFDVDAETMTYDYEAIARDIETYGLFTYEELNAIYPLSEAMFEAAGGAYLKISIGKGNLTMEELGEMINRYSKYV